MVANNLSLASVKILKLLSKPLFFPKDELLHDVISLDIHNFT